MGSFKKQRLIDSILHGWRLQLTFLLAHATVSAFLRAVFAILTILAGVAGVGTCAGRCGSARWNLADEKNRQDDLSENEEKSWFEHRLFSQIKIWNGIYRLLPT